jgi:hypothetical protein
MSQENVEIVWAAIDGRRVDVTEPDVPEAFVERLDPEVEFEEDPSFPEAVRDNRAVRIRSYLDRRKAHETAGISK